VEQALKSEKWKNAMDVEMDALMRNGTWDKCILPQGKKPIGCRWIFTIKYKPDVAKIDTIRVLFSIAANQGWPLHQFDVKKAFLNGELKEEVYMEAPLGFSQNFKHGEVYHTLYLRHRGDRVTRLIIYIDDMIIIGNDESEIKMLKEGLCAEFEMKDLENLRYLPTLSGLETKETEDQLLDNSHWLEVIWSHGKVKSKKSFPYQVLRLNSE
nr:putative ribonuclease H-like domain-containing protein [Tanacetum cinerariifolium]